MKQNNRLWAALAALLFLPSLAGCGKTPLPPASVQVEFHTDHTAQIVWEAVEGADGYRIFKRNGVSDDYQYLDDVEQNHYTDAGLVHGETYSYKVKALIDGRLSDGTESDPIVFMDIPSIIGVQMPNERHFTIIWEDTSAAAYRLYGQTDSAWELLTETGRTAATLSDRADVTALRVSAVYQTATGAYETPCSAGVPLLHASNIAAVTQLDRYTAAVQYEAVPGTVQYRIYRSEERDGSYILAGTSYDAVYYDDIENGKTCFYKVQPVADTTTGPVSQAVQLGTNARAVSGLAVFMYHEFVTREDLNAGIRFDEYAIWAEEFEEDLRYLKENGYTTITSAQLDDFLNGRQPLPEKAVILTIDDGKLGVYKHAYPLLQKYGMKAVLAVIGERIDAATNAPAERTAQEAPYCTWDEIREMSDSGAIEIVSHSYLCHRYRNNGRTGADLAEGQSEANFYQIAFDDYNDMDRKLREMIGKGTVAFSYPYSVRSEASDRVWMQCGYQILFCGDSDTVRHSQINYYIQDAGVNYYSARTRRIVRMTGTSLQTYLEQALSSGD